MARSPSTVHPGGEINISTLGSPKTAEPPSPLQEQEAKAETVFSLSHSSEADLKALNTTEQAAITSSKVPTQEFPTTAGASMALPDLGARVSRSVISEGGINISVRVPSLLLRQDKGTQTSEGDFTDLFHNSEVNLTAPNIVGQALSTTSERATHGSSRAAVTNHNDEAPVPAALDLKIPQEKPQTVAISQRTVNATETQQDHTPQAQISREKGPEVGKSTVSRNKSNRRIDAADVSAPFRGSRSWHPLTSVQRPVVNLPLVSTVSFHQAR